MLPHKVHLLDPSVIGVEACPQELQSTKCNLLGSAGDGGPVGVCCREPAAIACGRSSKPENKESFPVLLWLAV